jgi:hypothetical protein
MSKVGTVLRAFDALVALREVAKRFKGEPAGEAPSGSSVSLESSPQSMRPGGQLEATLTNVVVAALKEAFDRDHARLQLERDQIEEQRRRAEEALRMELRRQAAERELHRLRMLSATALVGWMASLALFVARAGVVSLPARVALAAGWLFLLGALGTAFSAQGRVGAHTPDAVAAAHTGPAGALSLWLLIAGLAATAISLLL